MLCQRHTVTAFRDNSDMTPGERLRKRRKELQLDVKDVAAKVGMGVSTLYEIENGRQRSSTRLYPLCKALGLRVEYVETGRPPQLLSEPEQGRGVAEEAGTFTVHGMQTSPEEVEVGIEWGKLEPPIREVIRQQIYLLVAEQVRKKRAGRKPGADQKDGPHRRQ